MSSSLAAPTHPRSPWQRLYGQAHRLRRGWYRRRARRLPRPVVSVGNLHWGGAGKTPIVACLARHLRDGGRRVAILSRGYGRRGRAVTVVSAGDRLLADARAVGDEPMMLAGMLPGVAVVVGPDRHTAGLHALARLEPSPDLMLLDDGFSHLRLERDLDLLVFPVADPLGGGRLPPGGRLREPLVSSRHADALLLTGPGADADTAAALARVLSSFGFEGPAFAAPSRVEAPRLPDGRPLPAASRVVLVSAIGRPQPFVEAIVGLGFHVVEHLRFADHHRYPGRSLAKIERAFARTGAAAVVTTDKDRVKLAGRLAAPLAVAGLSVTPEAGLFGWLEKRLELLGHGSQGPR